MFRFLFVILFCLSFLSGCGSSKFLEHKPTTPVQVRTIHWVKSKDAFATSSSTKKPVLIYFSIDDFVCELMQKETMSDPEVAYFINKNFVPIIMNGKSDKYEIKRFPTILILSSTDSGELMRVEDVINGENLLEFLKVATRLNSLTTMIDVMKPLSLQDFGLSSP